MALLQPQLAMLDETDSGLDLEKLQIIGEGAARLAQEHNMGVLVITHYKRLLNYIKPTNVHLLLDGKIAVSMGPELVDELEAKGFDYLKATYAKQSAYRDLEGRMENETNVQIEQAGMAHVVRRVARRFPEAAAGRSPARRGDGVQRGALSCGTSRSVHSQSTPWRGVPSCRSAGHGDPNVGRVLLGTHVSDGVSEQSDAPSSGADVREIVEAEESGARPMRPRTRPWRSMRRAKLAVRTAAFLSRRPIPAVSPRSPDGDRYDIMEPVAMPTLTALYFGRALNGGSRLENGVAYSVMGLPWGTVQDIRLKTVGEM